MLGMPLKLCYCEKKNNQFAMTYQMILLNQASLETQYDEFVLVFNFTSWKIKMLPK